MKKINDFTRKKTITICVARHKNSEKKCKKFEEIVGVDHEKADTLCKNLRSIWLSDEEFLGICMANKMPRRPK
jgi:hypothetical protein